MPKSRDTRPSARKRGYTTTWDKARRLFLRENPICTMCQKRGWVVPATVVDHIKPHRGDSQLFWDRRNWQALCKPHHDRDKQQAERLGYSLAIGSDGLPVDPSHPFNR